MKSRLIIVAIIITYVIRTHCYAAISYVATETASCGCTSSPSSLTINKPSGVVANDFLIAHITMRLATGGFGNLSDLPAPSGWTQLDMQVNSSDQMVTYVYYKVAGGSEPASYDFTDNSVALYDRVGAIIAYRGVDVDDPIESYAGQLTPSGTTHSTLCASATTEGSIVVVLYGNDQGSTWTPPSGFTERYDLNFAQTSWKSASGADINSSPSVGSVGGYDGTSLSSGYGTACILVLRPSGSSDTFTPFFVGSTFDFACSDPLVLRKPTLVEENDFMIAHFTYRTASGSPTPPSGWTLLRDLPDFGNQSSTYIYYKVAGASEPATYSFTMSGICDYLGAVIAYRGIATSSSIDVENGQTTANSTSHSTPSITTTVANDLLVVLYSGQSTDLKNWTPPGGWVERSDVHNAQTSHRTLMAASMVKTTAGSVAEQTATAVSTSVGAAEIVALKTTSSSITTGGGCGDIFVLPIELTYLDAEYNSENDVIIKWITATETNNDFFTIERSTDTKNFDILATVKGAGNSNKAISYSFTDINPANGILYYRLKQTDYDGNFKYSNIVAVKTDKKITNLILTQPYYNGKSVIANVLNLNKEKLQVEIIDYTGALVYYNVYKSEKENIVLAIPTYYFAKNAAYFMRISNGKESVVKKFTF